MAIYTRIGYPTVSAIGEIEIGERARESLREPEPVAEVYTVDW
jgi:hypothetical protein